MLSILSKAENKLAIVIFHSGPQWLVFLYATWMFKAPKILKLAESKYKYFEHETEHIDSIV